MWNKWFGCVSETLEINSQPEQDLQENIDNQRKSSNLINSSFINLTDSFNNLKNKQPTIEHKFVIMSKKKIIGDNKKNSSDLNMTTTTTVNNNSTKKNATPGKNIDCELQINQNMGEDENYFSRKQNVYFAKTAGFIVASSIYGQLLVVICLAFFTAELYTSLPLHFFESFYSYLYSISILFLLYVYIYLLKGVPTSELRSKERKYKKDRISETEKSHGSIFLRIGAVGFGLGSMVYNGLEFGSFFEIPYNSHCYSILLGINPVLQATFTFAQMYFIFTYSRLMIHKFKLIARVGLMHLVGTNICIWIRTLGKETLQELKTTNNSLIEELFLPMRNSSLSTDSSDIKTNFHNLINDHYTNKTNPCEKENIMGSILSDTSPYLYPFIVEYSLIGAAFLYVMWSNIGRISNYYHGQYIRNISNQMPNTNHQYPLHHHSKQRHHLHHHSNHQIANASTVQTTVLNQNTINQVNKSGSVSPTLSTHHQVNIITDSSNSRNFNSTSNELLDANNSLNCSPTNQTTNASVITSPAQNILVTKIQTTPPSNRKIIMVDYNKSNNINTNANYSSNILLDNISTGSSYDSFNAKYTYTSNNSSHSPYKEHNLQSMYHRNHLMNSSQSLYSCLGSSKGLFCGFLFLVVSITSLIIFFVLVHHTNYHLTATLISEISHSILLILSSIATIAAFFKIRKLKFQPGIHDTADGGLRDLLLKVAAFGLYVYSLFGVIAAALNLNTLPNIAVLITSSLTIIQVTLQSLFISDVICRKRSSSKQPGRQIITFLLIANLTLWIIYTFEMQKVEASPVQLRVYGFNRWALIVRITLPLSIFYRFHSAITFAEVWKNSYK